LTSLEQDVDTLSAENESQRVQIKDQQEYLASDRDIRELMGARQLFIADIFDIADDRTQKPFGRVFYTKGKSLVFYAFDLDRQAHVKNASSFQVWGQKGRTQEGALNLGILYMDNEANRRWALRLDDPAKLQQIDAVFVTIEPHGGSERPTGKAFLYAYLKKDANHP
jgi:GH43 family beta-xylosidase